VASTPASYEFVTQENEKLKTEIEFLKKMTVPLPMETIVSLGSGLTGLSVSRIVTGNNHQFWGSGHFDSTVSLANGTTYWLMRNNRADFFPELSYYVGDPTIAFAGLKVGGQKYVIFLEIDAQGMRFTPDSAITGITAGTPFNFTQLLTLTPPS